MEIMESICKYKQEEQVNILATLKVVQDKGWSAENQDPLQFHIILGAKITFLEENIKLLESALENDKEENLQNKKDLKDIKSELQCDKALNLELEEELNGKVDEIDHMKKDLQEKEEEIEEMKKYLYSKESEFDDLEVFVKERVEEIKNLRENNLSMAQQFGEVIKIEKKVEIQSKVIQELQENLKQKQNVETAEEVNTLLRDIGQLQMDVQDKEQLLEKVNTENNEIKERLFILEEKNNDLKKSIENANMNLSENISLQAELEQSRIEVSPILTKCKICAVQFETFGDLREHMKNLHEETNQKEILKTKVKNLEWMICQQKLNLSTSLYTLKENELKENQMCRCRGWCGINHQKYGWKVSQSEEILTKMKGFSNM